MKDTVVINFGRYQGPHRGHEMLSDFMRDLAKQHNADYFIYPSKSYDKKNPIPYNTKVHIMKQLLSDHAEHIVKEHPNAIVKILQSLQHEYKRVLFVCGSDRSNSYRKFIPNYNGMEYNFDDIQIIEAGNPRDENTSGVAACSASKMREYVSSGDIISFTAEAPRRATRYDVQLAFNAMKVVFDHGSTIQKTR